LRSPGKTRSLLRGHDQSGVRISRVFQNRAKHVSFFDFLLSPLRQALPARPRALNLRSGTNQPFVCVVGSPEERVRAFAVLQRVGEKTGGSQGFQGFAFVQRFARVVGSRGQKSGSSNLFRIWHELGAQEKISGYSHIFSTSCASLGARVKKSGISHLFSASRASLGARENVSGIALVAHFACAVGGLGEQIGDFPFV